MTQPGIEPRSPGPLANTLPTWSLHQKIACAKLLQNFQLALVCLGYIFYLHNNNNNNNKYSSNNYQYDKYILSFSSIRLTDSIYSFDSFFLFCNPYLSVIALDKSRGYPRGVMVKAMGCRIVENEFVLQSRYYIHFQANTLGKGMNPLILPAMG